MRTPHTHEHRHRRPEEPTPLNMDDVEQLDAEHPGVGYEADDPNDETRADAAPGLRDEVETDDEAEAETRGLDDARSVSGQRKPRHDS